MGCLLGQFLQVHGQIFRADRPAIRKITAALSRLVEDMGYFLVTAMMKVNTMAATIVPISIPWSWAALRASTERPWMAFRRSSSLFSMPLPTSTGTGLFCSAWTVESGGSAVRALLCGETSQGRAGCENCSCSTSKAASVKSWQIGITNDMPEKITHNWQSVFVMGCNLLHGFLGLKLIGWPRRRAA